MNVVDFDMSGMPHDDGITMRMLIIVFVTVFYIIYHVVCSRRGIAWGRGHC